MLLAQGTDLIVLFLGLELLSITLYVLVGFAYPRLSSEEAAMKYLLIGAFAAGFLVFGIALIYGATGTIEPVRYQQRRCHSRAGHRRSGAAAGRLRAGAGRLRLQDLDGAVPYVDAGCVRGRADAGDGVYVGRAPRAAGFAALVRVLLQWRRPAVRDLWLPAVAVLAALTMIVGNIAAVIADSTSSACWPIPASATPATSCWAAAGGVPNTARAASRAFCSICWPMR